jgi:hypothetical protein
MNMGISQRCDWCNNQFILDGYFLLHNMKTICHQMKDPKKRKRMRFYYGVSLGQLAPTIPSVQKFYQDLWNDRKMKKVMRLKNNQPTGRTRHLLGAFAASHPQIPTMHQEQIIALARMSLLLEVKTVAEDKYS